MSDHPVVERFRASLSNAGASDRKPAPFAVALGAAAVLGFVLVGPLASRGLADDTGILSFFFREPSSFFSAPFRAPRERAALHRRFAAPVRHASTLHRPAPKPRTHTVRLRRSPVTPLVPVAVTVGQRELVSLLKDATLRRGDAVMTLAGVRIFRGAHRFPLQGSDFRQLSAVNRVPHRRDLLAIDRITPREAWSAQNRPLSPLVELPRVGHPVPLSDTASRASSSLPRS